MRREGLKRNHNLREDIIQKDKYISKEFRRMKLGLYYLTSQERDR